MIFIEAADSQPLSSHDLLNLNQSANVRTGLVMRDTRLTAAIKFLVHCSSTFRWRCNKSFDDARRSNICKNAVSRESLQCAAKVTTWRNVRVKRLVRRYSEALKLFEKVDDEVADSDSASEKSELCITLLDGVMFLQSKSRIHY